MGKAKKGTTARRKQKRFGGENKLVYIKENGAASNETINL